MSEKCCGKYVDGGYSPPSFAPYPKECPDAQATAWDFRTRTCFKMFGVGVLIGDRDASIHAGFEVCNVNFHSNGTCRPVVNPLQLNGPVFV